MLCFLIGLDSSRLFSKIFESTEGLGRFSSGPESTRKRGGSGGRSAPSKSVEKGQEEVKRQWKAAGGAPLVENGAAKSAQRTPRSRQEAAKSASGTLREAAGGGPGGLPIEVEKTSVFGP